MPKLAPWNVLAGSSDKIRSAVAEMRRAIGKGRVFFYVIFVDLPNACGGLSQMSHFLLFMMFADGLQCYCGGLSANVACFTVVFV